MITVSLHGRLPTGLTPALIESAIGSVFRKTRVSAIGNVAVCFVTDARMQSLNQRYRGKRRSTDVLSFAAERIVPGIKGGIDKEIGDLFISTTYARREAHRRSISLNEEILRLIVHGTLHLLGYDHATETTEQRMFSIQEGIVDQFSHAV